MNTAPLSQAIHFVGILSFLSPDVNRKRLRRLFFVTSGRIHKAKCCFLVILFSSVCSPGAFSVRAKRSILPLIMILRALNILGRILFPRWEAQRSGFPSEATSSVMSELSASLPEARRYGACEEPARRRKLRARNHLHFRATAEICSRALLFEFFLADSEFVIDVFL